MWFNAVPEPKTAKNRLHFDLRAPSGLSKRNLFRRLTSLGAVVLPNECSLVVLRDPEGNEFCVE